jgi:ComEC/Rec2-related protein
MIAVLLFILRMCKVGGNAARLAALPFLGFYCVLCGFAPGVLRASLMFAVYAAARLLHRRYDSLNALSLAAILTLLFMPSLAAGASFQLSYLAVFAAVSVAPVLMRLIQRPLARVPKRLRQAACLALAVQIITFPITVSMSGFTPYAVLSNIIILPLISLCFTVLFPAALLALILPFMSFLLAVPGLLARAVIALSGFTAGLPYSAVTLIPTAAAFLVVPALYAAGKYVMLNFKRKAGAAAPLLLAALIALCAVNVPPADAYSVHMFSQGVYDEYLLRCGGASVYVGRLDFGNRSRLTHELFGMRIRRLDAVFLTDTSETPGLKGFIDTFKPSAVYVPDYLEDGYGVSLFDDAAENSSKKAAAFSGVDYAVAENISARYVYGGDRLVYLAVSVSGYEIVIARTASVALLESRAPEVFAAPDLYISRGGFVPEYISPASVYRIPPYGEYAADAEAGRAGVTIELGKMGC